VTEYGEEGAEMTPSPPLAGDEPIGDVVARLLSSARSYAEAEIDRQTLRAALLGAGVRTTALLVLVALILLFASLVALMIGLVIALAPLLTAVGAALAVALGGILVSVALALLARRTLRRTVAEARE
jgi:hypothetical protein